ncbi:MAG: 3-methyl-2-oxobutanoate dehydrogenase subunit VorB [Anaerolineales bacterium]|uniref:3-methyl-2-oxobutanoate dehydrogenase subunit VorB n=1 Tax=Candidatus Villigracilis affinis TaxID=3140682 RepID=UPI002A1939BE|nr:3-methyl-2-oxobutanoate dehydrogenase subunit VorB [Anaerolineales bacterium]MBL0343752.1 3-methyl-2-oxobutanoate dehydrogenase subunit VorB [Anaerolineales bacterium]
MPKELWKGNEAIAEAAVRAGLEAYFGYPITPQTEILEYLSRRMPELGRAFVQAESELGAINMVYGAACTGVRVMSSSSSPGVSLMMEGISYIAGTEVPAVLVNVMRGGPGLGNIAPAQADYNQAVHGGGHGDYQPIVLAPASVQEAIDLMVLSFDLAEKYRSVCMMILDGCVGQMMEPAQMPEMRPVHRENWDWATNGKMGKRERRILSSIYIEPAEEEKMNLRLLNRWQTIQANEVRYKEYFLDDAEIVIVGFGTAGRVALSAVREARAEGIKVGLLRPVTVSPFPSEVIEQLAGRVDAFLVTEMNSGQMLEDVRLAVKGRVPVEFYGRLGGMVPFPDEILNEIHRMAKSKMAVNANPRDAWLARMATA